MYNPPLSAFPTIALAYRLNGEECSGRELGPVVLNGKRTTLLSYWGARVVYEKLIQDHPKPSFRKLREETWQEIQDLEREIDYRRFGEQNPSCD